MSSLTQTCEKISVFDFKNQSVRTFVEQDGRVWFCLADVCRVLHIKNPRRVAREMLKQEGVRKAYAPTNGGEQEITIVDEPNLYRVIFRSNKVEARQFQDWVFEEVLPQIRQTGMYQQYTLLDQYNKALLEFEKLSDVASEAGRMLNLAGKRFKPKAKQKVIELSIKIQPYLPFSDFGGVK